MFKKFLLTIFIFTITLTTSLAEIVNKIEVDGNKRLTKEAIILFSKIQLNKDYDSVTLNSNLKELYQTNFFKSVKLDLENNILYIVVVENPIIENLRIEGIKKKQFTEKLYDFMALKSRSTYQERLFQKDLNLSLIHI